MFKPVALPQTGVPVGDYVVAAGQIIPFGAAVTLSAAGSNKIVATKTANEPILGVAGWDKQEMPTSVRAVDGFYSEYEKVPVYVGEIVRVLVVPNAGDYNIDLGDYLEVCAFGSGATGTTGVFEEAGTQAGTTFTIYSGAKALEYVTMGDEGYKVPASNVAVGDTHIHMTAGEITTMGLEEGDYIVLEDLNGEAQMNKIKSLTTANQIDLVKASTVALTTGNSDLVHRVYQCKAKLLI